MSKLRKILFINSMFYSPLHGSPEVGELALEERLRGRGVSRSDEGVYGFCGL